MQTGKLLQTFLKEQQYMSKMKILVLVLTFLTCQVTFSQNIDTSFVIKTQNSSINIKCKKIYQNGEVKQSTLILNVMIGINSSTIDEALSLRIKQDKYYASLHYDNACNLSNMSILKSSENKSFNLEVEQYFEEFINAYNSNNLKKYLNKSETECGKDNLIFSYRIE